MYSEYIVPRVSGRGMAYHGVYDQIRTAHRAYHGMNRQILLINTRKGIQLYILVLLVESSRGCLGSRFLSSITAEQKY
jgi:hypothetical protein